MNILLIEDDPDDRALVASTLARTLPAATAVTLHGSAPLQGALEAQDISLVLVGNAPERQRVAEILRDLRQHRPGCPAILLGRDDSSAAAVAALKAGLDDYVVKSEAGLRRLGPAIREAVERASGEGSAATAEDRVRHWLQITPASLCQCTADGRFVEANTSFRAMLAIDAGTDLQQKRLQDYLAASAAPDAAPDASPADLQAIVAEAETPAGAEILFRRADGSECWTVMRVNVRRPGTPGFPVQGNQVHLECAFTDITDRKREAERVATLLREKNVLIEELYHRVNNNLQIVMSFVHQLVRETAEPAAKANLRDLSARIQSLALVQDQLYRNQNFAEADLRQYIEELCAARLRGTQIALSLDLTDLHLPVAQAIPIGLIANELLVNAIQHAFTDVPAPEIAVTLRRVGPNRVALLIQDNGVGLATAPPLHKGGYRLINLLARQIGAELAVGSTSGNPVPGTCVEVAFPLLG